MSPFDDLIGRFATLRIRRFGASGAFLVQTHDHEGPEDPTILLIGSEIPAGTREGDELRVFVYLDSEDRPLATTRVPKLTLGEVAFLDVTACTEFGAFVDFGLPKELLVPFAEHTTRVRVGSRHPIGLYRDGSGRLAGTMRVGKLLDREEAPFTPGQWVQGEMWRDEPNIGLFVIIERRFVGLVPASEPHAGAPGQAARFRVAQTLPDGKLELSLRGHAHEELENDAREILAILQRSPPRSVREGASPDEIRARFGLSKKAFKRAVGRLLRQGAIRMTPDGYVELKV
jgi:predicted RNA-binding protein (virulence factor B family)